MWRRNGRWGFAAGLLLAACGGMQAQSSSDTGAGTSRLGDADEAWLDSAEVRVTTDACAGTETVELVNAAAGKQAVVDTESFTPDTAACKRS